MAKAKADSGDILAACDAVRDSALVDLGVRLEDRPDGAGPSYVLHQPTSAYTYGDNRGVVYLFDQGVYLRHLLATRTALGMRDWAAAKSAQGNSNADVS